MTKRALALAAVCVLLAACAGGTPPAEGPSDASVAATPTADATTSTSEEGPRTLGNDPSAEAAPGQYQSDDPPVTLTVSPPRGALRWFGLGDPGFLFLRLAAKPCDGCEIGVLVVLTVDGDVQSAAKEWQDLKPSSLSKPKPVKLGGARGVTFRGKVSPKPGVSVVHGGFNPYGSVVVYVLAVDGQTVVVCENQVKDGEPVFREMHKIVQTMRFTT